MRFLVAQLGARMHYAVPRMLHEAGMLERFYTDICAIKGWPQFLNLIPNAFRPAGVKRLLGRVPEGVPREKVCAFTRLGWDYQKARKGGGLSAHLIYGRKFCETVIAQGFGGATATYTFNSAGLELMRAAKGLGIKTVMEQTIAPRAVECEILSQAVERYPDWGVDCDDPDLEAFIEREEMEWELADLILCGSEFVAKGIQKRNGPIERCAIVPYGVDTRFNIERSERKSGPLRVLTVGQVGLRKGSPVIWDAARIIGKSVSFRMVGEVAAPVSALKNLPANVELTGVVPRRDIESHYKWADVFLLPSLCEGSATVTYEAMMAGLPVICTPNTGAMVIDGVDGLIVPVLDADAIVRMLSLLIDCPEVLCDLRNKLKNKINEISVDAYSFRVVEAFSLL